MSKHLRMSTLDSSPWKQHWQLRPGVTYLNHGSFGPAPTCVIEACQRWQRRLESQPMDFLIREFPVALAAARGKLGQFVGAAADDLVFVENATTGMNVVAKSVQLAPGDEVLLNTHEYGAVFRIWERACREAGATLVTNHLALPLHATEEAVDGVTAGLNDRTRLLIFSHVTSPTAVIFPAEVICRRARERGVPTCIDGPHAIAMLPLAISSLDCDYYTASCHKWLCGPFGSGFLYVHPRRQADIQPPLMSWGRPLLGDVKSWRDELEWVGTRDPEAFLAVPTAIEWLEGEIGVEAFRRHGHELARYARQRLAEVCDDPPLVPDDGCWYGTMAACPLPPGDAPALQRELWERFQIEVPIVEWQGRRFIRVSAHGYNERCHVDYLLHSLRQCRAL